MATPVWTGATDGNVGTAANYSPAAAPAAGDEFRINGTSTRDLDTNMAALTAVTVDKCGVHATAGMKIGAAGTPFDISATRLYYAGRGAWAYFTGTYANVICATQKKDVSSFNVAGTITILDAKQGWCGVTNGAALTTAHVTHQGARQTDVILYVGTSVTGFTTANVNGGVLDLNSSLTTLNNTGGKTILRAGTLTTANISAGAVEFRGGTITTANVYDGAVLDTGPSGDILTLTTINMFEGSVIRLRRGVIFGSAITLNWRGQPRVLDIDESIAVTLNLN